MTNDEETLKILRKIHKEMKFDNDLRLIRVLDKLGMLKPDDILNWLKDAGRQRLYPMTIQDPENLAQLKSEKLPGDNSPKTILGFAGEGIKCTGSSMF